MNTLLFLLVAQFDPVQVYIADGTFLDATGSNSHISPHLLESGGFDMAGNGDISLAPGILAASGLASTVSSLTSAVTTLQGQIGQAPSGTTTAAPTGTVGEFIQTCRAKGSAVTISGTTTLVSQSLAAGVGSYPGQGQSCFLRVLSAITSDSVTASHSFG